MLSGECQLSSYRKFKADNVYLNEHNEAFQRKVAFVSNLQFGKFYLSMYYNSCSREKHKKVSAGLMS